MAIDNNFDFLKEIRNAALISCEHAFMFEAKLSNKDTSYTISGELLTKYESPNKLVDLVDSIVTYRILTDNYGGIDFKEYPTKICSQRFYRILSRFPWHLMVDKLRNIQIEGASAFVYANDLDTVLRSYFLAPLTELTQRATNITQIWNMAKDLTLYPPKNNAMTFTSKCKL